MGDEKQLYSAYFLIIIPLAVVGYENGFREVYGYMNAGRIGRRNRMTAGKKAFLLCAATAALLFLTGISKTVFFEKTIGLNESEEIYEELYYQNQN